MNRLLLLFALACAASGFSLTLTEAEYFVGADPGQGSGTPVTITPSGDVSINLLQVPTAGLPVDKSHALKLRFRSEEGFWSIAESRPFFFLDPPANTLEGRSITHVEYWFDNLTPVFVDLVDDDQLNYAALIPTSGLAVNASHKFSVKYTDNTGKISGPEARYFFLHQGSEGSLHYYDITHIEYQFNADPSVLVDIANGLNINFADLISVEGLDKNLTHKFAVRYLDERGLWSAPEARYFFIHRDLNGTATYYNITHVEYWYDNDPHTLVDVTDGTTQYFADSIVTDGLALNVSHKYSFRYKDERGYWSAPEARYFFLHQNAGGAVEIHDITHVEYWFDELSHSLIDIADAQNITYMPSLPHGLSSGPHFFRLRYHDDRGLRSLTESRPFFVWPGVGEHGNARLAGAEYFVNVDPGVGNGVQIEFTEDGAWDEQNETAITVMTGIPTGVHLFGIRFKDELGHWSLTLADTFVVGPVLVIKPSGTNIVLSWVANPDHTPFRVYRANTIAGTYSYIGQSDSLSYTDVGISASAASRYYQVTVDTDVISSFFRLPRAPDNTPARW